MAVTVTDFNVAFQLGQDPMVFRVTDVQDYTPAALADLTGKIKITAPSGVVYDNLSGGTPDLDLDVSRVNSTEIKVPLLADGTPEIGLYTFEYVVTDSSDASTATLIKNFNFTYSKPTPSNTATADCVSPELSGSDTTNYLVNGVTPVDRFSVASSDAVANTFRITGEKVGFFVVGETFDITGSANVNNDLQYTITAVDYDLTNNETVVSVANVPNSEDPETAILIQRRSTLYFVSVPDVQPIYSNEKTISTNDFYSQTQSFSFDANVYYDFGSGFSVVDSFYSHKSIDVQCDSGLCDIFCCVNAVYGEYIKYKGVNDTLANISLEKYGIITSHLTSLRTALDCGDTQAVTSLTDEIKKVAQCNSDCDCSSDQGDPIKITGLATPNIVVVQSGGNGINVVSNTAGNTTTYTLTLDQATVDKINSITANTTSSVVAGNSTVTVTPAADTPGVGNTQYSVSVAAGSLPTELLAFDLEIVPTGVGTGTLTPSNYSSQNLSNLTGTVVGGYETTTSSDIQAFFINTFQTAANATYKVFIEVVNNTGYFNPFYGTPSSTRYDISRVAPVARISVKESGKIEFVLLKSDNTPYTVSEFNNAFTNVKLNVKIVE